MLEKNSNKKWAIKGFFMIWFQPLAFVLAKMEIAGITVRKETLLEMRNKNELVIEKLTQEIYELAGEELISTRLNGSGVLLFENWKFLGTLRKPRQVIRLR